MDQIEAKEPPFGMMVATALGVLAAMGLLVGSQPPSHSAAFDAAAYRFSPAGPSGDPGAAGYESLRRALLTRPTLASRIRRALSKGDLHAADVVTILGPDARPAETDLPKDAARDDLKVTLRGI